MDNLKLPASHGCGIVHWTMNLQYEQSALEKRITFYKWIAWIFVVMGFVAGGLGVLALPSENPFELRNLDSLGSFYQGTVASFWSLGALFFIYVAFLGQKQSLCLQQAALAEQKAQFEAEQKSQKELVAKEKQQRINGVLQAIRYEIEVFGKLYQQDSGVPLELLENGKPYLIRFAIGEKYLIVYPNNTEIVGQIDDPELCKAIIATYSKTDYLIESFRINNWYLDRLSELTSRQYPYASVEERLIKHAARLKDIHNDVRKEANLLPVKIDKYLAGHPVS